MLLFLAFAPSLVICYWYCTSLLSICTLRSGCFALFLTFTPSLAICSGYCTSLPGICTLRSGCFAPFPGVCTLACNLLWVLHFTSRHLHPALWVLCSFSWYLHPRLPSALGTVLCFPAFAPSHVICSGYCTSLSGICTLRSGCFATFPGVYALACYLLWVLHSAFRHLYPEFWVLCSSSWRLHPRLLFALGTTLHFQAFAPCALGALLLFLVFTPSLAIYSGYCTSLPGICTLNSGYFALFLAFPPSPLDYGRSG